MHLVPLLYLKQLYATLLYSWNDEKRRIIKFDCIGLAIAIKYVNIERQYFCSFILGVIVMHSKSHSGVFNMQTCPHPLTIG